MNTDPYQMAVNVMQLIRSQINLMKFESTDAKRPYCAYSCMNKEKKEISKKCAARLKIVRDPIPKSYFAGSSGQQILQITVDLHKSHVRTGPADICNHKNYISPIQKSQNIHQISNVSQFRYLHATMRMKETGI